MKWRGERAIITPGIENCEQLTPGIKNSEELTPGVENCEHARTPTPVGMTLHGLIDVCIQNLLYFTKIYIIILKFIEILS